MKPVDQTMFGGLDSPPELMGNCYPACIASLLEIELSEVPHFYANDSDIQISSLKISEWMKARGLFILQFDCDETGRIPKFFQRMFEGYEFIVSGKSPRYDSAHACIGRMIADGVIEIAHDPHPSRMGIASQPYFIEVIFRGLKS